MLISIGVFNHIMPHEKSIESFAQNQSSTLFKVDRPFVNLYDNNGKQLNVTLLSRPFYMDSHYKDYEKIKEKFLILGISSYQEFPNQPKNPKDGFNENNKYEYKKWVNMCDGWLHCFRNPSEYLPKTMKNILLSESDFADCNLHKPNPSIKKKYDFLYVCHRDDKKDCSNKEWVAYNKNLELAEKCFAILCEKYNYKGLLVGRSGCKLPNGCENKLETTDKLDYGEMIKKYDEVKFIFLPNISDASPRVLTEALCHNIPCLVNKNIVGGWKYVTPETGEFFTDENDFPSKLEKIMGNLDKYEPRKHFIANYGIENTGTRLCDFIYDVFGDRVNIDKSTIKYITPDFEKVNYETCKK
jgi:hypothetical protein